MQRGKGTHGEILMEGEVEVFALGMMRHLGESEGNARDESTAGPPWLGNYPGRGSGGARVCGGRAGVAVLVCRGARLARHALLALLALLSIGLVDNTLLSRSQATLGGVAAGASERGSDTRLRILSGSFPLFATPPPRLMQPRWAVRLKAHGDPDGGKRTPNQGGGGHPGGTTSGAGGNSRSRSRTSSPSTRSRLAAGSRGDDRKVGRSPSAQRQGGQRSSSATRGPRATGSSSQVSGRRAVTSSAAAVKDMAPPTPGGAEAREWNAMREAHGIALPEVLPPSNVGAARRSFSVSNNAVHLTPEETQANLAGQIGRWQKMRSAFRDEEQKIKCGLCIVPPDEAWGPIEDVRRSHDRHHLRWMPHINLKYPVMLSKAQVEQLPKILEEALRGSPPFNVSLATFGTFQHPLSSMLWARPNQGEYELRQLHYILSQVLPLGEEEEDRETKDGDYEPHLCLGQWASQDELESAMQEISGTWNPVTWEVRRVLLVTSRGNDDTHADKGGRDAGKMSIKAGVDLTGETGSGWVAFECSLEKPLPKMSKFQRNVQIGFYEDGGAGMGEDALERQRLAKLASALRAAGDGRVYTREGAQRQLDVERLRLPRDVVNLPDEGDADLFSPSVGGTPAPRMGRWGGVMVAPDIIVGSSGSEGSSEENSVEYFCYSEMFASAELKLYRPPDVLRAPPLKDEKIGGDREDVVTFADLPIYPGGKSVYSRPTLEELVLELARSSLHGMKSRFMPRAAKILVGGTEEEREWLAETVRKKQRMVRAREDALSSKMVFNRKVASAMGGSANKGQVSLLQVRDHTWNSVIVEARREFFVNKLRLEAFESEERQARRWSVSMTRDVMQHLTMLNREEVQALISRREEWCRVKDVLQTQGSLTLEQSLVSLLEEADLEASGQLAFDFVMAWSEYEVDGRPGWDEQINSRRESAMFKMDVNDGLPGWYVYYDMYGWC